jgi:exopolysaccharide/PEP-CTERM locus tyrosine autokinase
VTLSGGSPFIGESSSRRSREVSIDLARLAAQGYVTPDAPRGQLADEFRVLKRPFLSNAQGKSAAPIRRANLIMITSSLPGEGKTFTSINLALSIAMEVDTTVLLVDADVARPAVLDRLGLPSCPGLLDLLTQPDYEMADVLLKTNVDRLSILPAGTPHPRATELLTSAGMSRLLDELAGRYSDRIVVFDAPPLLLSTESRALATQVGQVLLVVEAEKTTQNAVTSALSMVESCPVVLTVLNKVEPSQSGGGYYGQYGQYGE